MSRSVRVAALQLRAHDRANFSQSLLDGIVAVAAAASETADMIVLPEGTLPGYVLGDARIVADDEEAAIARALDRLAELAQRTSTAIVIGAALRSGESLRNAAMVIDRDGSTAGRADKLFLWHFDRRWFDAGERVAPIQTSLGKLGVLVCADGRLPTIARALVDEGAEMLVMPTAWVTTGRDPHRLENVQADLLARVRGFENGVPFIAANKCGAELGMVAYCGKSQIVAADGRVIAIAGEFRPETLAATVTIGADRRPYRVAALARPDAREAPIRTPIRIAISVDLLPRDIERRLELLDDAHVVAPHRNGSREVGADQRRAALDRALATASVSDDEMLDPAGLVPYRQAGYVLAVWTTRMNSPWIEPLARARALELRMYLIVLDCTAMRAFAVDPDGAVVAGTFGDYRLASFSLDPRRTIETEVAPGTDISDGLERIAAIVTRKDATRA
jgi:predicted amidohydrolase